MKLISISGLDGSGKTTQLDLIEKSLKKKFKLKRFHMIDFSIANRILKKPSKNKSRNNRQLQAKTKAGLVAIMLRKIAIIIDVFSFRFYYLIKSAENKTDYLLVDRYFYDQIINIKYLDKNSSRERNPFWQKVVENQIIQPFLKIYLKVNFQEVLKRDRKIEQGEKYLQEKKVLYDSLSKKWRLRIIDGNKNKQKIQQKIKILL